MIPAIRWRIGLTVFLVFTGLQLLLAWYLLDLWAAAERDQVDAQLLGDLQALMPRLSTPELAWYIRTEREESTRFDETFFDVRTLAGESVERSDNVPGPGLGAEVPDDAASSSGPVWTQPVRIWDHPHPRSRSGKRSMRIAELQVGGYRVRIAKSLDQMRHDYRTFRGKLLRGLIGVALLGAVGAGWVARRSLAPIRAMTERARELESLDQGSLPRTGTGDELDRLGSVLNDLLDGLRSQVLHVRRVSADAAHALKTPLAAIRAALELHVEHSGEQERRALLPVLESLEDTIAVVKRLLFLENLEANPLDPGSAEPIALDAFTEDLVATLQPVAQEQGVTLKSSLAPAVIRGDPLQLRSALLNVLENALQHTPCGGSIHVTLGVEGGEARLRVLDSGPGLRPEQLERAFERFYSERRDRTGTGLGLPIARAIARAHGGSLTASAPGGACFEFRFPLSASEAPAARLTPRE